MRTDTTTTGGGHSAHKTVDDIERWIVSYLVENLGLTSVALGPETRLFAIGLDSVEAVGMAEALETWLGRQIAPTIAWEQPTIAALSRYLAGLQAAGSVVQPAAAAAAPREPDADGASEHPFATYVNPDLGRMLGQLSLDKRFVRGAGCTLFDHEGLQYLDFIAAYGALPLGHNPPEIWQALLEVRERGEPNLIQPSYMNAAGELAARLLTVTPPGMRYVTFANSGAEAIEAAIKMCRTAKGRPGILSTARGFHGKTLGALSATGNDRYQGIGSPAPHFDSIPFGDITALRAAFTSRPGYYAAFIVEAIQGEGGIVEPPPGYLPAVRAACDAAGVLLVLDEIQSGLGRTGAWFACEHEGVVPDVMTLAKALSGGLVPIGAVVASASAYTPEFARKHSSTFAGGSLACRVGLATLGCLSRDNSALIRQVAQNGQRLKAGLQQLAAQYPHLISEVRGRGYFLGLRFGVHRRTWPSSILGVAAEEGGLAPIFASYLLNVERVRLAPTLNGTDVMRIEPPLIATWQECEAVLGAIGRALAVFALGDTARVLGGILERAPWSGERPDAVGREVLSTPHAEPQAGDARFAFLLHPLELRSYADFDSSLSAMHPSELETAVRCVHGLASPAVVGDARITSANGQTAFGEFIMLGHTAAELMVMSHDEAVAVVGEAVDLARDRGARIVGLGAFTSIVTQGGLSVSNSGVAVTSGNSYTVVAAYRALMLALTERGITEPSIAVIGAGGAIGRAISILLAEHAARLILVGNPHRSVEHMRARLLDVVAAACQYVVGRAAADPHQLRGRLAQRILASAELPGADAPLAAFRALAAQLIDSGDLCVLTQDARAAAQGADALATATSATGALFEPDDFRPGAVICDVSRPRNVGPELRAARPDLQIIDGGIVEIPGTPDIGGFGLPRGHAYACMAETMILALEQHYENTSMGGDLPLSSIDSLRTLGDKHGFRVVTAPQERGAEPPTKPWRRDVHGQAQHLP